MTTYTKVFGNETVPPTDNSYIAVSLTADTTFDWPEISDGPSLIYDTMDISSSGAYTITMPNATAASVGKTAIMNNLSAHTLTLNDATGNTIGTILSGKCRAIYLTGNSSTAGTWNIIDFGSGTNVLDASAIVGYGLKVIANTLAQNYPSVSVSTSYNLTLADRAAMRVFTGSGAVNCIPPTALSAGNGYFVNLSNQGAGSVTVDPQGSETIDGQSTKALSPGESMTIVCDGTNWVSLGYGRSTQFQFTKLVLDISVGSPFTLSSTQAQNKLIQFTGIATANVVVNVPSVVAIYYVQCSYSGNFTLTLKTSSGAGITINNSDRAIAYCDGVDVVLAQTSNLPASNVSGGTAGALVYQIATNSTGFMAVGTPNQIAISGGTNAPTWTNMSSLTANYTEKTTFAPADMFPGYDSAAPLVPTKFSWANFIANFLTVPASKTTPVDADTISIWDSVGAALKKLTWANLKATLIATAMSWTANQRPNYGNSDTVSTTTSYTYDGSAKAQVVLVTVTNAITVTFAAPSNIVEGSMYKFILKAGDTSARTYSWNSAYKFPTATAQLSAGTQTTGAYDVISFIGGSSNTLIFDGVNKDVR